MYLVHIIYALERFRTLFNNSTENRTSELFVAVVVKVVLHTF